MNPRQAREVARILAHYRRAKTDLAKKGAAVQEAMAWGPGAVSALSQVISKEMQTPLEKYRNGFLEQANRLSKDRVGKVDVQEIGRLRATVLDLSKLPDLSKETIVEGREEQQRRSPVAR